jgi:hypothetical protein
VYRVEPVGEDITSAIDALPPDFLPAFAEVRVALEVSPWSIGQPYNPTNSVEDSDRRIVWLWSVLVVPG